MKTPEQLIQELDTKAERQLLLAQIAQQKQEAKQLLATLEALELKVRGAGLVQFTVVTIKLAVTWVQVRVVRLRVWMSGG